MAESAAPIAEREDPRDTCQDIVSTFKGETYEVHADGGSVAVRTEDCIWHVPNQLGDGTFTVLVGRDSPPPPIGTGVTDLSPKAKDFLRFHGAFALRSAADILEYDCGGWDGKAVATLHPGRWTAYRYWSLVALMYHPEVS